MPEPSTSGKSCACPPSNGSPSTVPWKSMITRSPLWLGRGLCGRREVARPLGEVGQRLGHRLVVDRRDRPGQLDRLQIDLGDLGQDLERHGELEIGALVERGDLDLGPQRRPQLVIADRLLRALVDRLLDHLAHHRAAVLLAQQGDRHLARPEAGHPDGPAELAQAAADPVLDLVGVDDDLVFALQSVRRQFGNLHRPSPASCDRCRPLPAPPGANPHVGPAEGRGAGGGTRTPTACATRS